jgi:hypothetical protein
VVLPAPRLAIRSRRAGEYRGGFIDATRRDRLREAAAASPQSRVLTASRTHL